MPLRGSSATKYENVGATFRASDEVDDLHAKSARVFSVTNLTTSTVVLGRTHITYKISTQDRTHARATTQTQLSPLTVPPRTQRRLAHANASLTSRSEALVSRHDALLRQLHRPLRPCLRLLRALALQVAFAPDLVELQAREADVLRLAVSSLYIHV